jgi:hypothetical protein
MGPGMRRWHALGPGSRTADVVGSKMVSRVTKERESMGTKIW